MTTFDCTTGKSAGPLQGARVLELTTGIAGRMATGYLALLGADVVAVRSASVVTAPRDQVADLGKRIVEGDVAGADIRGLIAHAEVIVTDDVAGLTAVTPVGASPVILSMSTYAAGSPFDGMGDSEAEVQAVSGLASMTGPSDEAPLRVGPDAATQSAALYAAIAAIAGLIERARVGEGRLARLSVHDAAMALARSAFSRTSESGHAEVRSGNRQPAAQSEPTGAFPAGGGGDNDWVYMHANSDRLWPRLLTAMGRDDLLDDPRFASEEARLRNAADVHAVVNEWTSQRSKEEVVAVLGAAKVPIGATLTVDDLLADEALLAAGQFADIDVDGRSVRVPWLPFSFDGTDVPLPTLPERLDNGDAAGWAGPARQRTVPSTWTERAKEDGGPLSGIRVADLTQALSGPAATQVLALLGAEVTRVRSPLGEGLGVDRPWLKLDMLTMNKRSATLNLKDAADLAVFRAFAADSDVVAENFAPGTMDRLGLGADVLRALQPNLVIASVKGFPSGSKYESLLAFEPVGESMGGGCALTGRSDGTPMLPGPFLADMGSGLAAAMGILAVLYQRTGGAGGAVVTTSMQGTVATIYARFALGLRALGGVPVRRNGFADLEAPEGVADAYKCGGGGMNDYVYVDLTSTASRDLLAAVIGDGAVPTTIRGHAAAIDTAEARTLREGIEMWASELSKYQASERLRAAGITAAPIVDTLEALDDPSASERGTVVLVDHPVRGAVPHLGFPVLFSGFPVKLSAAPTLDEHTDELRASYGPLVEEVTL